MRVSSRRFARERTERKEKPGAAYTSKPCRARRPERKEGKKEKNQTSCLHLAAVRDPDLPLGPREEVDLLVLQLEAQAQTLLIDFAEDDVLAA